MRCPLCGVGVWCSHNTGVGHYASHPAIADNSVDARIDALVARQPKKWVQQAVDPRDIQIRQLREALGAVAWRIDHHETRCRYCDHRDDNTHEPDCLVGKSLAAIPATDTLDKVVYVLRRAKDDTGDMIRRRIDEALRLLGATP